MDGKVSLSDIVKLCDADDRIVVYVTHGLTIVDTCAELLNPEDYTHLEVIKIWCKEDAIGPCLCVLV